MLKVFNTGQAIFIVGPARVRLISGEISLFGAPLQPDRPIIVPAVKSLSGEAESDAQLDVTIGSGGYIESPPQSTIPPTWAKLPEKLRVDAASGKAADKPRVCAFIGPSLGKSTAVQVVSNLLLRGGSLVGLLDLDLGQQSIGSPTTVTASLVDRPFIFPKELTPLSTKFIGAISPLGYISWLLFQYALELRDILFSRLNFSDFIVIDTDGWIDPPDGLAYKLQLLSRVKPDVVTLIAPNAFVAKFQSDFSRWCQCQPHPAQLVILEPPNTSYFVTRSRRERSFKRLSQLTRKTQNMSRINLNPDLVEFFHYIPFTQPNAGPSLQEEVLHWNDLASHLQPDTVCGLFDTGGNFLGIGFLDLRITNNLKFPTVHCSCVTRPNIISRIQIGYITKNQIGY